mmetsp:Transcript_71310/g.200990  ORF Transcript_71310/g.200990 Transcript_71310/m.200990 type:complete len:205 (+) Transcript_71310:1189-1803(+)
MHRTNSEVCLAHLSRQPVHLLLGVAEDDGLCDGEGIIQITESIKLPLLTLDSDEELFNTLESKLITLDEHAHRLVHELFRHVEDLLRHSSAHKHHLGRWWKVAVYVVDLFFESLIKHLVSLIDHQHLQVTSTKVATTYHVEHAPRSPADNLHTVVKSANILTNTLTTNACVALNVHVVTKCKANLLGLLSQLASRREGEDLRVV